MSNFSLNAEIQCAGYTSRAVACTYSQSSRLWFTYIKPCLRELLGRKSSCFAMCSAMQTLQGYNILTSASAHSKRKHYVPAAQHQSKTVQQNTVKHNAWHANMCKLYVLTCLSAAVVMNCNVTCTIVNAAICCRK